MVPAHLRRGRRPRCARAASPATISSRCCRTAGRPRRCTGPASSPASSSRRSTGAPPPTTRFLLRDAEAKALVYEDVSREAVRGSRLQGRAAHRGRCPAAETRFATAGRARTRADAQPRADADAWSVMLYTSGTTARPKGVPRRQRAERAAALAHVAQNLYRRGERTLGVMPLYHTMGVRSLLAMSLIGGAFVCLPRFDAGRALELIAAERITNLYLVPTLYHDLLHHPRLRARPISRSVRKLGFAGALDDRRPAEGADRSRSSRTCSSITTARRRSTPLPSTRTRRGSPARPDAPASTSWSAW